MTVLRTVVTTKSELADELADAVHRGRIIGSAVNAARDLANQPGNVLSPRVFASRLTALGTAAGLSVDVLDEARIRALGMTPSPSTPEELEKLIRADYALWGKVAKTAGVKAD